MQHDIFISHHKDSSIEFVSQLAEWFEKGDNINCWYAPRNLDSNGAGKDYDDEIVEAIQKSKCIVVVLNDMALQSKWVKREVAQAEKQGKMIFPIVISELTINNGLLMRLEDKHLISAYPNPKDKYPLLLKNVKQLLGHDTSSIVIKESAIQDSQQKTHSSFKYDIDFDEGMALIEVDEPKDAFYAFLRSAENGNKDAEKHLYQIMYENNKDVNFVNDDTWAHIEELSDEGLAFADMLMHYRYYGMGTQSDIAMKYLKRCMSKEIFGHAFLQLGICYGWGLGVQINNALALHYYKKALDLGCVDACRYIGQLYTYGGYKIKKDYEKAEEYIRKGIKLGSKSCYEKLFWLLVDKKELDAAKKIAETMISQNNKDGYRLMGEYFRVYENDSKEASQWYQKAIKLGEKKAWGCLALIKRYEDFDTAEAYKLAENGFIENESFSYFVLGWFYEDDENYQKAWECYYKQIVKFGIGADNLGRLYLEKGYIPDNFSVENLKIELRKSQDVEAIKYLLRILIKENTQQDTLTFELLRDIPETYDYLCLGANLGDEELSFMYGKILIESEGKIFNSYSGIEFVEYAAMKSHSDAMKYALTFYNKINDADKLEALSVFAVEQNVNIKGNEDIVAKNYNGDKYEMFLEWMIKENQITNLQKLFKQQFEKFISTDSQNAANWIYRKVTDDNFKLYNNESAFILYLSYLMANRASLDNKIINQIRASIIADIGNIRLHTVLPMFEEFVSIIFPDYSHSAIMQGKLSNERDCILFFALSKYLDTRHIASMKILQHSPIEQNFYNYLLQINTPGGNSAFEKFIRDDIKSFHEVYARFAKECEKLCLLSEITPTTVEDLQINKITPYCSNDIVFKYCKIAFYNFIRCQKAYIAFGYDNILENIQSHTTLLDIAEKMKNEELQSALISFVELSIYAGEIISYNIKIRQGILNKDRYLIADELNKYISSKPCSIGMVTAKSLPESIFCRDSIKYIDNVDVSKKNVDELANDEFDRLLDEFIEKNLPKQDKPSD